MVKQWVHIKDIYSNYWVDEIWTAFDKGVAKGNFPPKTKEISELALHISTRLEMIPWIVERVKSNLKSIGEVTKNIEAEHISTPDKMGFAFDLDREITYKFLIDFDTFMFEIDSCCELIITFIRLIYGHVGQQVSKRQIEETLKENIQKAEGDSSWFESFQSWRNFSIHKGAPYFAIDLSDSDGASFELLVTKENLKSFEDDTKYIKVRSLFESIQENFFISINILQRHLIDLLSS